MHHLSGEEIHARRGKRKGQILDPLHRERPRENLTQTIGGHKVSAGLVPRADAIHSTTGKHHLARDLLPQMRQTVRRTPRVRGEQRTVHRAHRCPNDRIWRQSHLGECLQHAHLDCPKARAPAKHKRDRPR